MLNFIVHARPYLEAVYFLASIGLLIGVVLSLRQLRLMKTDIDSRNIREARAAALHALDAYAAKFVPLSGSYFDEWKSIEGLTPYVGPIGNFSKESIPQDHRKNSVARFALTKWLVALNQLESMSANFTSGVADEALGFKYIGRSFCFWVERNYDVIAGSRSEAAMPHWQSIVELYLLWRPRLTTAELEAKKDELVARLRDLTVEQAVSSR
ncbi:hypothetical protein [Stenotrophomonas sp. JAG2]|uniref:hypothetical protein n=1 Tax=Stenotrophomonas sp. JAG2 TaxID=3229243 RepID=UPI0034E1B303